MPNYYVARVLTQKLGLNYVNICTYVKGCILFWGDHKYDVSCPNCGNVQYKYDVNKVLFVNVSLLSYNPSVSMHVQDTYYVWINVVALTKE